VNKTNFGLCFQTNALSMGGCLRNLVLFIFFCPFLLLEKLIKINLKKAHDSFGSDENQGAMDMGPITNTIFIFI
jgi:hypothetical protein